MHGENLKLYVLLLVRVRNNSNEYYYMYMKKFQCKKEPRPY